MSARVAIPWTVEERDELARRYEAGEPMEQIARALKRSHGACAWQAHLLGLRRSNVAAGANVAWTPEEDATLMVMLEHGRTIKQAAERLGRPWRGVSNRVARIRAGRTGQGFGGRPKGTPQAAKPAAFGEPGGPWSEEQERVLKQMRALGADWEAIADAVGRSVVACKVRRTVLGLDGKESPAALDQDPPWIPPALRPRDQTLARNWERINARLCAIAHPGLRIAYGRKLQRAAEGVAYPGRASEVAR